MAYSQTRSIYHGFIAIFFLANIFCELLSIINPRNTLIWSKYEYWKVFLTEKSTHFMNVWCRYFSKILYKFTFEGKSYEPIFAFCCCCHFCMSAKHNISGQSTFYTALKTLKKSTHFMLTHLLLYIISFILTSFCK